VTQTFTEIIHKGRRIIQLKKVYKTIAV